MKLLTAKYFMRVPEPDILKHLNSLARQIRGEVDAQLAETRRLRLEDSPRPEPIRKPRCACVRIIKTNRNHRRDNPKAAPLPGEIPLMEFVQREMRRRGVCGAVIYAGIRTGRYPGVQVRHVNGHVKFVTVHSLPDDTDSQARPGEVSMKEFVAGEAARLGITEHAVYQKIRRGRYPGLQVRRANNYRVFVTVPGTERKQAA